jgi:hypothetical protein
MFKHSLLILTALCSLTIATMTAQADLVPDKTQLTWNSWDIKVRNIFVSKSVDQIQQVSAADDTVFVVLALTVQNNSHEGARFIPQNAIKIVIGDDKIDAADLGDEDWSYAKNIEPTLIRDRACYFEVPKALVKDSFIVRFSAFLTETQDINVTVKGPLDAPTPIPVAKVQEEIKDEWNKPEIANLLKHDATPEATPTPSPAPVAEEVPAPSPTRNTGSNRAAQSFTGCPSFSDRSRRFERLSSEDEQGANRSRLANHNPIRG